MRTCIDLQHIAEDWLHFPYSLAAQLPERAAVDTTTLANVEQAAECPGNATCRVSLLTLQLTARPEAAR